MKIKAKFCEFALISVEYIILAYIFIKIKYNLKALNFKDWNKLFPFLILTLK